MYTHSLAGVLAAHVMRLDEWDEPESEARAVAQHYLKEQIGRSPSRPLFCCPECGCTDIQFTAWVHANTGEPTGDEGPTDDTWCPQCEENYHWPDERDDLQPYDDDADAAELARAYRGDEEEEA